VDAPLRFHHPRRGSRADKKRGVIDRRYTFKVCGVNIIKSSGLDDAGIGNKNIQPSVPLHYSIAKAFHFPLFRDVGDDAAFQIGYLHNAAFGGKKLRDTRAEALRAAGNDCRFAF
jgi:hypothetical protein